jgi:hypothetical protein
MSEQRDPLDDEATTERIMEAMRLVAAELAPDLADEDRAKALRNLHDKLAVSAEQITNMPTFRQIADAFDRLAEVDEEEGHA